MKHSPFAEIAHTLGLRRDLHRYLDHLGAAGLPLQHVPVPGGVGGFWLVQQPALVREVLLADDTRVGKPAFLKNSNRGWRGDGLTTLEGPAWKARRAAIMQTVSSEPLERRMRSEAREATLRMLRELPGATPFDLSDVLLRLVARIALGWTLSADPVAAPVPFGGTRHPVPWVEAMGAWHRIDPEGEDAGLMPCARLRPAAVPTLEAIIRRRWREPDDTADDFLAVFHRVCREQGEQPGEDAVVDEVLQWLFAGHHTMSTTLWHALARLQANPQACERIRACAARHGAAPAACLPPGTFTEAFVKEVMRLCMPTALLFRQTRQPLQLGQASLGANELIVISPYLMQRDPRWFAQPLRFDPARFEGPIDSHAYLALGAGRRRCAAHRIALSQLTMVLETVVACGAVVPLEALPDNGFSATLPRPGVWARYAAPGTASQGI